MSGDLPTRLRSGELSGKSWRILLAEAADRVDALEAALQTIVTGGVDAWVTQVARTALAFPPSTPPGQPVRTAGGLGDAADNSSRK